MAITRAQQAKQMLQEGGMTKKIKGQEHMLAYITPGEADKLVELGGQETMTPEGIPAYPPSDYYGGTHSSKPSRTRTNNPNPGGFTGKDDLREQTSVAATLGKKPPTMKEVREIINRGPDDRGNPLQNRNQRNIVEYNKNLKKIEDNKDLSTLEKFNAKKKLKNQRYINQKYSRLAAGMAEKYGLSQDQIQALLDAYDRDLDEFDLSTFRGIVDAGAPPSIRSTDPNFLKAEMLDYSKRMSKIDPTTGKRIPLSTAELFDMTDPTSRIELPGILGLAQGDESFSNVLSGLNRLKTLDEISQTPGGVKQSDIDNYFSLTMGKGGIDPLTGNTVDALFYEQPGNDRPSQETDPCLGPNPPAYCNIDPPSDPNDPSTPSTGVFAGIAPRFAGSIFDFDKLRAGAMDGGIMNTDVMGGMADGNIDEAGRQMYFLGKLVKKAKRAVKKVVKSPFGKIALLGLGAGMAGFGPAKGLFASGKGLGFKKFLTDSIMGKAIGVDSPAGGGGIIRSGGLLNFVKNNPYKSIFAGSTLLGLMGDKDDDGFDIDEYYRTAGLGGQEGIDAIRYGNFLAPRFRGTAADGGLMRMGYQEGGDAEPVAKKTMPLIDMDGQEKDYRETGGFVDMGRMERADDVPARLSKNEFVFTADAVRNAGEGDIDKGAEVMYNMMKNLEAGGEVSEESQGLEGAREMFKTSQRLEEVL